MDAGLQKLLGETRQVFPSGSLLLLAIQAWDGSLLLDKNPNSDTILANLPKRTDARGLPKLGFRRKLIGLNHYGGEIILSYAAGLGLTLKHH